MRCLNLVGCADHWRSKRQSFYTLGIPSSDVASLYSKETLLYIRSSRLLAIISYIIVGSQSLGSPLFFVQSKLWPGRCLFIFDRHRFQVAAMYYLQSTEPYSDAGNYLVLLSIK